MSSDPDSFDTRTSNPGQAARGNMLRMARTLRDEGNIYQAISTYKKLMEDYPNNEESLIAVQEISALGEYLEQNGMMYMAQSLYEWLEQFSSE